jgi:hypothetical protein
MGLVTEPDVDDCFRHGNIIFMAVHLCLIQQLDEKVVNVGTPSRYS